jgi:hypothetical protein
MLPVPVGSPHPIGGIHFRRLLTSSRISTAETKVFFLYENSSGRDRPASHVTVSEEKSQGSVLPRAGREIGAAGVEEKKAIKPKSSLFPSQSPSRPIIQTSFTLQQSLRTISFKSESVIKTNSNNHVSHHNHNHNHQYTYSRHLRQLLLRPRHPATTLRLRAWRRSLRLPRLAVPRRPGALL